MRSLMLVVLVIAALIPCGLAQEKTENERSNSAGTTISSKPLTVSGKVSSDGKILLTDIDSEWDVTNPEALKGYEGSRVTARCYVDTQKTQIQILRVKKEDELKYAAKHSDSAFRR